VTPGEVARIARVLLESWELIRDQVPFPDPAEHATVSRALGLWASDPDTWSPERRRKLRADLRQRLDARRRRRGGGCGVSERALPLLGLDPADTQPGVAAAEGGPRPLQRTGDEQRSWGTR
jgi:hypothetical protein